MLTNNTILEYVNGDAHDHAGEIPQSQAPWYAVNPLVRTLGRFREAVESARI
jgi:hypothetical protein